MTSKRTELIQHGAQTTAPMPKTTAMASDLDLISILKALPYTRMRPEPLARASSPPMTAAGKSHDQPLTPPATAPRPIASGWLTVDVVTGSVFAVG